MRAPAPAIPGSEHAVGVARIQGGRWSKMMRSMFAGVSGLRNHQTRMDVIGNNVANVNTIGFKSGRVTFQELFAQTLRGASRPLGNLGGTNPQQVGLGMMVSSIDTIHVQGNSQTTGKMTDMAIQGNGFFIVTDGNQNLYTRAGAFDVDANGNLVDPSGRKVLGWGPDRANPGQLMAPTPTNLQPLVMKVGSPILAQATTAVNYKGNLDANTPTGGTHATDVTVFDSLGRQHTFTITFTKNAAVNQWTYDITTLDPLIGFTGPTTGTLQFTPSGVYDPASTPATISATVTGANNLTIPVDFSPLTQLAGQTTANRDSVNGYPMGFLTAFTIDTTGVVTGTFSNNVPLIIGRVAIANFNNPGGLIRQGEGAFAESNNSGLPDIGLAGSGGRGTIAPANVEMSNVDLAAEFTNMIITQRGFQANTRVITASDQMLQDLVGLVR